MLEPLTIAVAQPLTVSHDVAANAAAHADAIRAADARVVVFPELSLTGYELEGVPIGTDDPMLTPVVDACAAANAVALVGAPVTDGGGDTYIGVLRVDDRGAAIAYRKVWLGGAESARFAPGAGPAVLDVDGWRLGIAVCKDTGIPQHAADTAALGMNAYVAGVLEHAVDAGVPAERAHRIATEHGVWVAIASFAGSSGGGYDAAAGRSGIWAPDGRALVEAGPEPGEIARGTLVAPTASTERNGAGMRGARAVPRRG